MKNMSRRLFAALAATMMIAALGLAGCGGQSSEEPAKGAESGQEQSNATATGAGEGSATGEPVKLQIFAANSLTKAMAEAQELYTSQHPNVTFADTQYEGSGTLVEMLAAGQYADVLITASKGTMDDAVETANAIASEHLEILTRDPYAVMTKIENAGAIFLGAYSSEPLGDYYAGPNHILPTNGTAKFFSPLNVDDFMKKTSLISYSREALMKVHQDIELFAEKEGLTAHANSIRVRFEDRKDKRDKEET